MHIVYTFTCISSTVLFRHLARCNGKKSMAFLLTYGQYTYLCIKKYMHDYIYHFVDIQFHGIRNEFLILNSLIAAQLKINIIKHVVIIHNVIVKSLSEQDTQSCITAVYICLGCNVLYYISTFAFFSNSELKCWQIKQICLLSLSIFHHCKKICMYITN